MILIPCRDADPAELPRNAAALLKAALAAGWTARATYAKAEVMDLGRRHETFTNGDAVSRDGVAGTVVDVHRDKTHLGVLVNRTRTAPDRAASMGHVEVWDVADTVHVVTGEDRGSVVESVVVRLRRTPLAAVGAWHDGKFHIAYVWTPWTTPNKVGARALAKFVKEAA